MTLEYQKLGKLPRARYVPLVGVIVWFVLVPVLAAYMDTWGRTNGVVMLLVAGVGLPVLSLVIGLMTYMKIRVRLGVRDVFLSWCLAANVAVLLIFGFFLLLIWPIVLKAP